MKYTLNLTKSARRHLIAADVLAPTDRIDVAGYLYGIAAECAVKAMMIRAGIKQLSPSKRREDPYFLHFPQLQTVLRDRLKGRVSGPLSHVISNSSFMDKWSTEMRYSSGKEIKRDWIKKWAQQALQSVNSMDT